MAPLLRKAYRYFAHARAGGLVDWRTGEMTWPKTGGGG
jgi:hypothetical protein